MTDDEVTHTTGTWCAQTVSGSRQEYDRHESNILFKN